MLTASALTILSALLLVDAQSTNPQLEVQSIQAQFTNAHLVPDLISSFDPLAYLTVAFGGDPVPAGTLLAVADTQPQPSITATPANSSVSLGDLFTLAMVDPGSVDAPSDMPTRHWLVNGVTIGEDGTVTIPETATTITAYGAPLPPTEDAPHRYSILLWQQPETFTSPEGLAAGAPIEAFDLGSYVSSSGLGPVVAGWYFTCVTGEVTATMETSSVDTATLPAANSLTDGPSGTDTDSSTPTTTATTTPNAAGASVVVGPFAFVASVAAALFGIVVA